MAVIAAHLNTEVTLVVTVLVSDTVSLFQHLLDFDPLPVSLCRQLGVKRVVNQPRKN